MTGRTLLAAAILALACHAGAQGRGDQNVLRIEPVGEGEGKSLEMEGFYYIGSPNFSKDGEWIAFDGYKGTARANVVTECWVIRTDGTEARKVARGATPRWSPDGKQLLFMREERADLGRPGGDVVGVFVIDADGTNERRLFDGRWPEWSPDGKRVAFSVGGIPQGGARPMSRVCVANLDGSNLREVALGDCPSWSPDGKKIACCFVDRALGPPMIRVAEVDSEEQSFAGIGWFRANWSADGKSLYATGIVPGVVPGRAKAGFVRLTAGAKADPKPILTDFEGQSPCPSPDGKSLVFCTVQAAPTQVQ